LRNVALLKARAAQGAPQGLHNLAMHIMNRNKLVKTFQGATNMLDITMKWNTHLLLARTMTMDIKNNIDQMVDVVIELLHHQFNITSVKILWPMPMVSRVHMTMVTKAGDTAILQDRAITIVRMETLKSIILTMSLANPKSIIHTMSLVNAKSVRTIVTTTTTTHQVIWSPTNILVMD